MELSTCWQATDRVNVALNPGNVFNQRDDPQGGANTRIPGDPRKVKMTRVFEF